MLSNCHICHPKHLVDDNCVAAPRCLLHLFYLNCLLKTPRCLWCPARRTANILDNQVQFKNWRTHEKLAARCASLNESCLRVRHIGSYLALAELFWACSLTTYDRVVFSCFVPQRKLCQSSKNACQLEISLQVLSPWQFWQVRTLFRYMWTDSLWCHYFGEEVANIRKRIRQDTFVCSLGSLGILFGDGEIQVLQIPKPTESRHPNIASSSVEGEKQPNEGESSGPNLVRIHPQFLLPSKDVPILGGCMDWLPSKPHDLLLASSSQHCPSPCW